MTLKQLLSTLKSDFPVEVINYNGGETIAKIVSTTYNSLEDTIEAMEVTQWDIISVRDQYNSRKINTNIKVIVKTTESEGE